MSNTIRLREATRADLEGIVDLLADDVLGATREDNRRPLPAAYEDAFAAIAADPRNRLIIAEDGGRVMGCLQLTFIPGLSHKGADRAQIESVRVASDARGLGLGERLIAHAVDQARERGCRLVQLTSAKSRTDALRFYARFGFEATHEGLKLALD